jgi:hypothetical protein
VSDPAVGHVWQAFSRDTGQQLTGGLPIVKASGVIRHLGVDAVELTTPYSPGAYGRLAPGCGVVVQRDGVQQVSGMVGSSRRIGWDGESGEATITVQCLGDDQHLADRLVYPSPAADATAQTANYWTHTGPASSAMWELIRVQAGPGAQPARRVPTLIMGDDPGVGAVRLWSEQWANLLDTLTAWGVLSGADLGVRLVTTADGLRVDVYAPRDVSAGVRFSASLTNLTGWDLEQQPPSVTYAVAAGQGDLAGRVRRVAQTVDADDLAWLRRIERYVDQRDEADAAKVLQSAVDEVVQGGGTTSLSIAATDTATARYGVGWTVGDRVTVHVGLPGGPTVATVVDLVREVAFEVDATGREKITPAVGTSDAKAVRPGPDRRRLAQVAAGLARLTRNK